MRAKLPCAGGLVLAVALLALGPEMPAQSVAGPSRAGPNVAGSAPRGRLLRAQATKRKARSKRGSTPKAQPKASEPAAKATTPARGDTSGLKFSRDIAPILVGNCISCHNPERKRGDFDLTTFKKLMDGSAKEKVILPGKSDESPLVLHLKGDADPKMPPGNRELAQEAVDKIDKWVKAGAILDAGVDPNAKLETYAATPEQLRKAALARLSPQERETRLKALALERWKKAGAKGEPELTTSANFDLFSTLPRDRASSTVKALETQMTTLGRLLGTGGSRGASPLGLAEKVSVYIFTDRNNFVEFARAIENREIEASQQAIANLGGEGPYLAALDPLGGREDESLKPRPARSRKAPAEEPGGPERSLTGLLVEQLGTAAADQAGKPPRWLAQGLGAYLASHVEPRSPYYRHLRELVAEDFRLGWNTKAQEALGDATDPEKVRAIGFSLCEFQGTLNNARFALFVRSMLDDPRLDNMLGRVWNVTREQLLNQWGSWIEVRYGRTR